MGVSPQTVNALRDSGYEATHLSEENLFRMSDSAILSKAVEEKSIVLTFDLDFGDLLAAASKNLPSVIIFRLKNTAPNFVTARLPSPKTPRCQSL